MKKEDMLRLFKDLYSKQNRITRGMLRHCYECPSVGEYVKVFGSIKKVFELIGVDYYENQTSVLKNLNITTDYIPNMLIKYNNEIGYPTIRGLDKHKEEYISSGLVLNVYWTIKDAINEAGIEIPSSVKNLYERKEYTDEELINLLKAANKNRIESNLPLMTTEEIDLDDTLPHSSTYNSRLGNLSVVYKMIGIDDFLEYNLHTSDEYFKECYIKVRDIINSVPTSRDLDYYSTMGICPSSSAYSNHFGGMLNLQIEMGDKPSQWASLLSDEELIKMLVDFSLSLGITPTQNDIEDCEYMPSTSTYRARFGTFLNAITKAGLVARSEKKPLITPLGNYALSGFEYKYLLMLEKYNIKFKKEPLYKDYICGYERLHRFDFVINVLNENYFIEIFGLQDREDYAERTRYKIQLCKDNGLNLIPIYPEDIRRKDIDELYKLTMDMIDKLKN